MELILVGVLLLFTFLVMPGLLFFSMWTYNKARQKGYRFLGASLITVAGWAAGIIGAAGWAVYSDDRDFVQMSTIVLVILSIFVISVTGILLLTLRRRNPRVFGPRLGIPWYRLALFAIGVLLVFPAIAVVLWAVGKADWKWIIPVSCISGTFSLMIILVASILRRFDSLKIPLSIEQYLTEDPRPPVLYLRPFKMDFYSFAFDEGGAPILLSTTFSKP
jgi:hypothetical protein